MVASEIRYRIDADDKLVWLDPNWSTFAAENDAPGLTEEAVLGRPLLGLISGEGVRGIYATLFHRARTRGRAIEFPFRCDAPGLRRRMRMRIEADGQGGIELCSSTLDVEPAPERRLLDCRAPRGDGLLGICGWCHAVRCDGDSWLDLEEGIAHLGLLESEPAPALTHGICPACYRDLMDSADPES